MTNIFIGGLGRMPMAPCTWAGLRVFCREISWPAITVPKATLCCMSPAVTATALQLLYRQRRKVYPLVNSPADIIRSSPIASVRLDSPMTYTPGPIRSITTVWCRSCSLSCWITAICTRSLRSNATVSRISATCRTAM